MARTTFCESSLRILLSVWIFVCMGTWHQVLGTCSVPEVLHGRWYRASDDAVVSFHAIGMTGHMLRTESTNVTLFLCFSSSGDTFVFGLLFGVPVQDGYEFGYFCWKLTKLADNAYFLYELTAMATGTFQDQRVHGHASSSGAFNAPTLEQNVVCTVDPATATPIMMYQLANSTDVNVTSLPTSPAVQRCPDQLLGSFSYTKDTTGCAGEDTTLAFSPEHNTVTVDYGACAEKILYSEGGVLYCTAGSYTRDSNTFVYLINNDNSVDSNNYFRFVCLKFSETGTPGAVTVYPGDCSATSSHQLDLTPRNVVVKNTATSVNETTSVIGGDVTSDSSGGVDVIPIIVSVVKNTTSSVNETTGVSDGDVTSDSSGDVDIVPIVVGVVAAVVLIVLIVVGVVIYKKVFV